VWSLVLHLFVADWEIPARTGVVPWQRPTVNVTPESEFCFDANLKGVARNRFKL
jgi:hypothetical protein